MISPHILNYKGNIFNISSILHRITGFVTTYVTLLFYFLPTIILSLVADNDKYVYFLLFYATLVYILNIVYHTTHGLRHLTWDFGEMENDKNIMKVNSSSFLTYFIFVIPFLIAVFVNIYYY